MYSATLIAVLPFLTAVSSSPVAQIIPPTKPWEILFEFYPDNSCSSSTLSAKTLGPSSVCKDLSSPGLSFHIGGPRTQFQLPRGFKIVGYEGKCCKGGVSLEIVGPSNGSTCYFTTMRNGKMGEVNSVRVVNLED